ncbi:hypothetical protein OG455_29180 [Kitasatospora sp. NBC_01287]|uniref:hypothetical protein n=1 Tax=Kitasatospora sp. NBC_01287 TaxID=2903573 RepID=UPI0022580978|nr:hypothetical protein [Kitasatospora sp. NBC_01287]MCX4749536.1 hypothetical protein [Kitasatospora sp. NBC_01287]
MDRNAHMLPSHCPVEPARTQPVEADPETLDALVDSSRRLGAFWPLLAEPPRLPSEPAGPITVPDRTRALVARMAEYGL